MLDLQEITSIGKQKNYISERSEVTFESLKNLVVKKIKEFQLGRTVNPAEFNNICSSIIKDYVNSKQPYCEGYVKNGHLQSETLIRDLYNSITSWGKLSKFKEHTEFRELQINGPVIFVDTPKGYEIFRDDAGAPILFNNPDECTDFLMKVLEFSGERLTEDKPLVNASTIEGYRLACTHPCIFPPYTGEGATERDKIEKWPTAVFRKIGDRIFTRDDLIKSGTATGEMLDMISSNARCLGSIMCVGTTGCGKTTILNYAMNSVPPDKRVLSIQQPTEYYLRVPGEQGLKMTNNAVYFEVDTSANPNTTKSASLDNLVSQTLRYTGDMDYFNEIRNSEDFVSYARVINAGTEASATTHSFSIAGCVDRFAMELVTKTHMDMEVAKEQAARYLNMVVLCDRLGDGTRKVTGIAIINNYSIREKKYNINLMYDFIRVCNVPYFEKIGDREIKRFNTVGYFVKRNNPCKDFMYRLTKYMFQDELEALTATPENTIIGLFNFDKLPENYVVEIDSNINPPKEYPNGITWRHREPKDDIGSPSLGEVG